MVALLLAPLPAHAFQPGFMTGGGKVLTDDGDFVTHGFELHCTFPGGSETEEPNHLQVHWDDNSFHLETLVKGGCEDRNRFEQRPPEADFDTYNGEGTGRCNSEEGVATAKWEFTDQGEPGKEDTAMIEVVCPSGDTIVVQGKLESGNHQAHRARP